jgi:putative transposase
VLEGPVAARLTELLGQACEVKEWGLHELSVQPDQVHLLVQISPSDSVMNVMQILMQVLKGGTSRLLRQEFPELEEFLYAPEGITSYAGDSFWGDGYFAESVGQKEEAVLRAYIKNQARSGPCPPSKSKRTRVEVQAHPPSKSKRTRVEVQAHPRRSPSAPAVEVQAHPPSKSKRTRT